MNHRARQLLAACVAMVAASAGARAYNDSDGGRWPATASSGAGLQRGDATTLTWSIVPDGLLADGGAGSGLIGYFDGLFGTGTGGSDLTQRPWFAKLSSSFDRWSQLTGLSFVYQADDGAAWGAAGAVGARGDIRLDGRAIDGPTGQLAHTNYPTAAAAGGITFDTSETTAFLSDTALKNTFMHEIGHAIGLGHVASAASNFLMEPGITTTFFGPQLDDLLGAQRNYGDALEKQGGNDSAATATNLGAIARGTSVSRGASASSSTTVITSAQTDFLSIDGSTDADYFRFSVDPASTATISVSPVGPSYSVGAPGGSESAVNAAALAPLSMTLLGADGATPIAGAASGVAGASQTLAGLTLAGGQYFVQVHGLADAVQLYRIDLSVQRSPLSMTFNGIGATNSLTNGLNWAGAAAPLAGDSLVFSAAFTFKTSAIVDSAATVSGLWFTSNLVSSFTLGGASPLTLLANPTFPSVTIAKDSGFGVTITAPLVLGSDVLVTRSNATGNLSLSGAISGADALLVQNNVAGQVTLTSPDSTFAGGLQVQRGEARLGAGSTIGAGNAIVAGPAGTGTITLGAAGLDDSATLSWRSLGTAVTLHNPIQVSMDATAPVVPVRSLVNSTADARTYAGTVRLDGSLMIQGGGTGGSSTFAGGVSGAGGVRIVGPGVTVFSGAMSYAGATTVVSGLLMLGADLTSSSALSIADGAEVDVGAGRTLAISSLSIDGTLDVGSGRLILAGLSADAVRSLLHTEAIISSAATGDPSQRYGIGYRTAGTLTAVSLALLGDANLDGRIDADDFAIFDRSVARAGSGAHWTDGDFNADGVVDESDALALDREFAVESGGPLDPMMLAARQAEFGEGYVNRLLAAVPEPAGVGAWGLAMSAIGARRRGRSGERRRCGW